jgi:hypothetical protein
MEAQQSLLSELKKQNHACRVWTEETGGDGPVWDADGDVIECREFALKITADCDQSTCSNVTFETMDLPEGLGDKDGENDQEDSDKDM